MNKRFSFTFVSFFAFLLVFCQLFIVDAFAISPSDILSDAAVLIDADTGQILFEKNAQQRMYPASTTKIITALLTVEQSRPYEKIVVTESAIAIDEPASSNIALRPGEEITVEDALYALMLPSANDAANVLAEHIGGNQEVFAKLMTQKAQYIGAVNTNFQNAHGLHEPEHYTTAYDMALITRYAMGNADFRQYFGTSNYTMPPNNLQPQERPFTNYQSMLVPNTYYYTPEVTGGKVGYTTEAGHTMSTAATKNGRNLIAVVMRSGYKYDKYKDTQKLLDYGFTAFEPFTILAEDFSSVEIPARQNGVDVGMVTFTYNKDYTLLLPSQINPKGVQIQYNAPEFYDLDAPQPVTISLVADDEPMANMPTQLMQLPMTENLSLDVRNGIFEEEPTANPLSFALPKGWYKPVLWVIGVVGVAFILMLLLRSYNLRKRRRARQARLAARTRAAAGRSEGYVYTATRGSATTRGPTSTGNSGARSQSAEYPPKSTVGSGGYSRTGRR